VAQLKQRRVIRQAHEGSQRHDGVDATAVVV
jgi:hypothetical protein